MGKTAQELLELLGNPLSIISPEDQVLIDDAQNDIKELFAAYDIEDVDVYVEKDLRDWLVRVTDKDGDEALMVFGVDEDGPYAVGGSFDAQDEDIVQVDLTAFDPQYHENGTIDISTLHWNKDIFLSLVPFALQESKDEANLLKNAQLGLCNSCHKNFKLKDAKNAKCPLCGSRHIQVDYSNKKSYHTKDESLVSKDIVKKALEKQGRKVTGWKKVIKKGEVAWKADSVPISPAAKKNARKAAMRMAKVRRLAHTGAAKNSRKKSVLKRKSLGL